MDYTPLFSELESMCINGGAADIDSVMEILQSGDLPTTRAVDFHLGQVTNSAGLDRLEFYLFNGSQIQRNYATLFFARRNDWKLVNEAYSRGLIDYIQAYSR